VNGRDAGWHDEQQIANSRMELPLVGPGGQITLITTSNCGNNRAWGSTGDCLLLTGIGAREWKQAPR
jgi:hypothetical protein